MVYSEKNKKQREKEIIMVNIGKTRGNKNQNSGKYRPKIGGNKSNYSDI